jgi:hypothetical protein
MLDGRVAQAATTFNDGNTQNSKNFLCELCALCGESVAAWIYHFL